MVVQRAGSWGAVALLHDLTVLDDPLDLRNENMADAHYHEPHVSRVDRATG